MTVRVISSAEAGRQVSTWAFFRKEARSLSTGKFHGRILTLRQRIVPIRALVLYPHEGEVGFG